MNPLAKKIRDALYDSKGDPIYRASIDLTLTEIEELAANGWYEKDITDGIRQENMPGHD